MPCPYNSVINKLLRFAIGMDSGTFHDGEGRTVRSKKKCLFNVLMILRRELVCFHRNGKSCCTFLWWLPTLRTRHCVCQGRHMGLFLPRHHTTAIRSILEGQNLCLTFFYDLTLRMIFNAFSQLACMPV
mgnify:CR=1 FL=1